MENTDNRECLGQNSDQGEVSLDDALINIENEVEGKFLTLYLNDQLYGVPIQHLEQIIGINYILDHIAVVPDLPYYAKGVFDLRGTIIPLIDVQVKLGMAEKEYDDRTCVLISKVNERIIGFIVGGVDAVVDIPPEQISSVPKTPSGGDTNSLIGIARLEGKTMLLVDISKLLPQDFPDQFF